MNRTDQASEPTMEEILASIRLIISDDAKKAFPVREDHPRPAPPKPEAAPLSALPEEDVLDLTDALAPTEHQPQVAAAHVDERHAATPTEAHEEASEAAWAPEEAVVEAPEAAHEADMPQQAEEAEEPAHETREDPLPLPPPPSRTLWSRRELPSSPPSAAATPVSKYEAPARPAQRSWAQDIQMPIPNRGPVSLIPGQTQPLAEEEPKEAMQSEGHMDAEGDIGVPGGLGEQQEAAFAAVARTLARSAAGAMDSDELATAADVDFSKIGEEHKAEVTETFAKAIQKESAPRDADPLPTLLDEVFRHREPSADEDPAGTPSEAEASKARDESNESAEDERFGPQWGAPQITAPAAYHAPAPQARKEHFSRASETFAPPAPVRTASPAVSASGSPLEDAVRDMLRPLLVQWLNEHMPRILEGAIREEIATRGIFPKMEK